MSVGSAGDSFMLLSPTGTGKTLAFLVPLVERVAVGDDAVKAVVIVPSRELAIQIDGVFGRVKSLVRSFACYGGRPAMDENRIMRELKPQIVVGTPGRLLDHIRKGNIDLHAVNSVVLDEFDKSLELGFHDEMSDIFSYLPSRGVRRILTSATTMEEVPPFVGFDVKADEVLDFLQPTERKSALAEYVVHSPDADKLETLGRLLTDRGSEACIVFVNYRESVDRVGGYLRSEGFEVELFHGGMEQEMRERALFRFRSGGSNVLVSTDLSARGLDIAHVEGIVHYHLPLNRDAYIHRTGRTGRWDASGSSFIILNPKETLPEYAAGVVEYEVKSASVRPEKPRWITLYIGRGKKDKIGKADLVGFFCKQGGLRAENIGIIEIKPYHAYISIESKVARKALSLIQNEKIKGKNTKIELMKR